MDGVLTPHGLSTDLHGRMGWGIARTCSCTSRHDGMIVGARLRLGLTRPMVYSGASAQAVGSNGAVVPVLDAASLSTCPLDRGTIARPSLRRIAFQDLKGRGASYQAGIEFPVARIACYYAWHRRSPVVEPGKSYRGSRHPATLGGMGYQRPM